VKFVFFAAKKRSNKDKKKLTPLLPFEIFFAHTVTIDKNMRIKTLLIAAAALAAGLVSSQAQTVYSANVVGYANVVIKGGGDYTLVANPLDDGNGNQLTNLITTLPNKSQVITWNGTGYNTAITESGGAWPTSVSLPPGMGFFVKNGIASSPDVTNTFVGSVVVAVGSSVTNTLAAGYSLAGSPIPYAADATTDTNINLGGVLANKSQLLSWDTALQQFNTADTKAGGAWGSSFNVSVGQGFFIKAQSATNWDQSFNP
jgi:hypothetical protein